MHNNTIESRFLPYEADYERLKKWRIIGKIFLILVSLLSIARPIISKSYPTLTILVIIMEYLSYITIISYYIIYIVTEIFLYPATAQLRRIGLIDNSLGARFLGKDSKNYYSNDSLKPGLYKLNANCFENCFFTYNIAKEMTTQVIIKSSAFTIVFITTAYIGLKGNIVAIPILQILLSSLFLTELINHLTFISRLKTLLEKFMIFFNDTLKSKTKRNDVQHPILMLLEYETTLAFNKAPLSDKIYQRLNAKLSAEWEELKGHYEIA